MNFRKLVSPLCLSTVLVDNVNAAEKAVGMLVEQQHQKIGLIGGPDEVFTARQRMLGYMKALKDHGIAVDEKLICHGDYTIQGGVQAVEELVKENPDMTAVFVTNYEMTMGAVIGLNEMGVSMPEEISLVGFDNLPFARACRPALTIVSQPTEKIARETAQIMLERLEGREELPDHIVRKLQTDIFMGKSIRRQG